jgi:hypothetical protein
MRGHNTPIPLRVVAPSADLSTLLAALSHPEAEQALLGAILIDNRRYKEAADIVKSEYFTNAANGRIFDAIGMLIARGETADPVTLGPLFDQDPALSETGGAKYLVKLAVGAVTLTNTRDYAGHIADLWRRRSIVEACSLAAQDAARIDLERPGAAIAAEHAVRISEYAQGPGERTAIMDAANEDEDIDPRNWLLGNSFCRGFVSCLVAQGGIGKTSLRIAQALAMATRRPITGEHVFERSRVLIVSLEDDIDELRRRVLAARLLHKISREDVRGHLFLWAPLGHKLARISDQTGAVVPAELDRECRDAIKRHQIDALFIDPFIKAHTVPENDNSLIDDVMVLLVRLAVETNCAIDISAHEHKGGNFGADDAGRARGASSFVAAARLLYNATRMSEDERDRLGVRDDERKSLFRVDSAKVNIAVSAAKAKWFKLVGVRLGNGTELYPHGDEVAAVEPWEPPEIWDDIPPALCNSILDDIAAGPAPGRHYSPANRAEDRAAWKVVNKYLPNLTDKQCHRVIATWLDTGMIETFDYTDPVIRKTRSGLRVLKRPG